MTRAKQDLLDQLADDVGKCSDDFVVSKRIVEKIPAIFNGNKEEFIRTKIFIANKLGVDACSIIFVGSSCTGFSLNPKKDFKNFDEESDIDIAVISHHYFNIAWHWMRSQDLGLLKRKVKKGIIQHRNGYIFDGTIATDYFLTYLPFGEEWNKVINELERFPIFHGREVHFRLYQDHKSLIDYHLKNVKRNLPKLLGINPESVLLVNN